MTLKAPFIFPSIYVEGGVDVPYDKLNWDGERITITRSNFTMPVEVAGLGEMTSITDTKIQWRWVKKAGYHPSRHRQAPFEYDYLKWTS